MTELAPEEPRAWRTLAIHSTAAQDLRTAAAAYRRVDTLGKAGVDDLADLGDLLDKLGDRNGALDAYAGGLPWKAGFALLAAYAAAAVALGPIAMAAACRNALS